MRRSAVKIRVLPINDRKALNRKLVGDKVASLALLAKHRIPIPETVLLVYPERTEDVIASKRGSLGAAPWREAISLIEGATGRRVGAEKHPLLLSVRYNEGFPEEYP